MGFIITVFFIVSIFIIVIGVLKGKRTIQPINLPHEFYKNLKYFKIVHKSVYAVKKDDTQEIVFDGDCTKSAAKYLQQLQMGFFKWLEKNDNKNDQGSSSSVKFS